MDPADHASIDQSVAYLVDFCPATWAGMYLQLIERGVPAEAAIRFVCAFIVSSTSLPSKGKE